MMLHRRDAVRADGHAHVVGGLVDLLPSASVSARCTHEGDREGQREGQS
jgi:hypothetical protein